MLRLSRYGLLFAALAAMTLSAIVIHKHGTRPAIPSQPISEWDLAELTVQLNRQGIEVRLRAVPRNGLLKHSAYLTATAKEWKDLNFLSKDPRRIQEWHGTLYCEHIGQSDATQLIEQWGEHCLMIGPFLFYGDHELLEKVRNTLEPFVTSATG